MNEILIYQKIYEPLFYFFKKNTSKIDKSCNFQKGLYEKKTPREEYFMK